MYSILGLTLLSMDDLRKRLVEWLIARGHRTPYFHLYHADGTIYMERYWLMPRWMLREVPTGDKDCRDASHLKPKWWVPFAIRLHRICTIDLDRHMHNHPWCFVSKVLRGGYIERRPRYPKTPVFNLFQPWREEDAHRGTLMEIGYHVIRTAGDVAFRRSSDRHLITSVLPDTWTLVLTAPKSNDWGFFTEDGFVRWQDYGGGKMA